MDKAVVKRAKQKQRVCRCGLSSSFTTVPMQDLSSPENSFTHGEVSLGLPASVIFIVLKNKRSLNIQRCHYFPILMAWLSLKPTQQATSLSL